MPTVFCPACGQPISYTPTPGTECGGEGDGICDVAALAFDLDAQVRLGFSLVVLRFQQEHGYTPTVGLLSACIMAHEAARNGAS